jgi:hypothetical protein
MPKGVQSNRAKSDRHHRWTEEKIVNSAGYVKVRVGKSHPLADPNGYAYEHLIVWVSAGNSRPSDGEILHHINGTRTDNRIENLEVLTRAEHNRLHNAVRLRGPDGRLLRVESGRTLDGVMHDGYPEVQP